MMKKIYSKMVATAMMLAGFTQVSAQDYYLVWRGYASADGSGTEVRTGKIPFFASRNRSSDGGDGQMSTRFYTSTFKAADFWNQGIRSIRYHVENAAGAIEANSFQADYPLGSGTNFTYARNDDKAIVIAEQYDTKNDGHDFLLAVGTEDAPATFTAGKKKVRNNVQEYYQPGSYSQKGLSYAFFFDNRGDTNPANNSLIINVNGSLEDDADKTFYIIGNLANANPGGSWDPLGVDASGNATGRIRMVRTIYPIGELDETRADSIVYSATINRPANGWGNLYIGVAPHSIMKGKGTGTPFSEYDWQHIIRPQVDPNVVGNVAREDGTSNYGTLYISGTTQPFDYVSLNPIIDPSYTSYTFSMNITTATYRITFHTGLYIMGEAINGWNKGDGVLMTYKPEIGGWEQDVTFTQKGFFRFAQDESMRDCYGENGYAPLAPNTDNEAVAADDGDLETQYVNKLRWFNERVETHAEIAEPVGVKDGKTYGDINFMLDPGTYTVRFYARPITGSGNDVNKDKYNIYYTIDRKFDFFAPTQLAGGLTDASGNAYKSYRSFSNYHRMVKPAGVDVYIVTAADVDNVSIRQVEGDHIPAGTGVILAAKDIDRNTAATISVCATDPWAEPEGVADNLMKAAVVGKVLPMIADDGTYTMRFGYKRLNATDAMPTLGFFPQKGDQAMNPNSAYFLYKPAAASPAKALTFAIADGQTTGIGSVESVAPTGAADTYYTLQGAAVSKPTAKGVYIYQGKKVIIK